MLFKYVIVGFAVIICVHAQVSVSPAHMEKIKLNPYLKFSKQARHPRDVTGNKLEKHSKYFGRLSSDEGSVHSKEGNKEQAFNVSQSSIGGGYVLRALEVAGDSSHMRDKLDRINSAKVDDVALAVNKQIKGGDSVLESYSKVLNLDKKARLAADGGINHNIVTRQA